MIFPEKNYETYFILIVFCGVVFIATLYIFTNFVNAFRFLPTIHQSWLNVYYWKVHCTSEKMEVGFYYIYTRLRCTQRILEFIICHIIVFCTLGLWRLRPTLPPTIPHSSPVTRKTTTPLKNPVDFDNIFFSILFDMNQYFWR